MRVASFYSPNASESLGFLAERYRYGDVDNLWLRRGNGQPLFVLPGTPMSSLPGRKSSGRHTAL